jgi:hypothetical protein
VKGNGGQVKKILKHLGLWDVKARPPPRANALPKYEPSIDYSDSHLPVYDKWLYVEPEYPESCTG